MLMNDAPDSLMADTTVNARVMTYVHEMLSLNL